MKTTRVLLNIVYILLTAIFIIILIDYKDTVNEAITSTVSKAFKDKVIVPKYKYNNRDYKYETVKKTTDFEPRNIGDLRNIYYTVLENGWTSFTFYCPDYYSSCIDDVLNIANKSEYLEIINYYVSPYNTYSLYNTTVATTGEITLTVDKVYTDSQIEYLKKYVDDTLSTLNIHPANVTKNDLKRIHDHLIKNITYDNEYTENDINSDSNNAYGAIKNHKAICSGYTDAFAIFLDRLDIKNFKLPSEKHIWNYVYFEGKWYHVDLTWDDDEKNKNNTNNFFMISTEKLFSLDKDKHNFKKDFFKETKE